jgi:hypothetical protein
MAEKYKRESLYEGTRPNPEQSYTKEDSSDKAPEASYKEPQKTGKFLALFKILTGAVIIFIAIYYLSSLGLLDKLIGKQKFPGLKEPKNVHFQWEYRKQSYNLDLTVYKSVYDYYQLQPKGIASGNKEESVKKYLNLPAEDKSINELSSSIKSLATQKGFNDDQFLELTAAFVQSIPYDTERANTDQYHPRYPYEVLYDSKGICSDKSFLMAVLAKQIGYGDSIFLYNSENHMAVGIQCTKQYSTEKSGYCILETTAPGLRIGVIPEIQNNNQAVSRSEISGYNGQTVSSASKKLTVPEIISKTQGKKYKGIAQTVEIENQIQEVTDYLKGQKGVIDSNKSELDRLSKRLEAYKSAGDYEAYNSLVPTYNSLLRKINKQIDDYNSHVSEYNKLIQEY